MAGVMISTTDFGQHTLDQVLLMTDNFWLVSDLFCFAYIEVLSDNYSYSLVYRYVYLWITWGALHIVHYCIIFCLAHTTCYKDWFFLLSQFWNTAHALLPKCFGMFLFSQTSRCSVSLLCFLLYSAHVIFKGADIFNMRHIRQPYCFCTFFPPPFVYRLWKIPFNLLVVLLFLTFLFPLKIHTNDVFGDNLLLLNYKLFSVID